MRQHRLTPITTVIKFILLVNKTLVAEYEKLGMRVVEDERNDLKVHVKIDKMLVEYIYKTKCNNICL